MFTWLPLMLIHCSIAQAGQVQGAISQLVKTNAVGYSFGTGNS